MFAGISYGDASRLFVVPAKGGEAVELATRLAERDEPPTFWGYSAHDGRPFLATDQFGEVFLDGNLIFQAE